MLATSQPSYCRVYDLCASARPPNQLCTVQPEKHDGDPNECYKVHCFSFFPRINCRLQKNLFNSFHYLLEKQSSGLQQYGPQGDDIQQSYKRFVWLLLPNIRKPIICTLCSRIQDTHSRQRETGTIRHSWQHLEGDSDLI